MAKELSPGEGGCWVAASCVGGKCLMEVFFAAALLSGPVFTPGAPVATFFGKESESEETFINEIVVASLVAGPK